VALVLVIREDVLPVVAGICLTIFTILLLATTLGFTLAVWKMAGRKTPGDPRPQKFAERHRSALNRSKVLIQASHWKCHLCMWRETASRWF